MLYYLFSNKDISEKLLKYKSYISSGAFSYIALHISLSKQNKKMAIKYLFKSFMESSQVFLKKRFYVTVKNILVR